MTSFLQNLNELEIVGDLEENGLVDINFSNNSMSANGKISVYFRELKKELLQKIDSFSIVVGCVAWLTNDDILSSLAQKDSVSIIIQKEDFLRPDSESWSGRKLRRLYESLPPGVNGAPSSRYWGRLIERLNYTWQWESEPIRWLGNYNLNNNPAFPRMHNKFLIFCREGESLDEYDDRKLVIPVGVWTGSFNMTENATRSLENAVYIEDSAIVDAYYSEWQYIFSLSEKIPLAAWDHFWSPAFFRVGT